MAGAGTINKFKYALQRAGLFIFSRLLHSMLVTDLGLYLRLLVEGSAYGAKILYLECS